MNRPERGPLMPDNPRRRPGLNVWAVALWVLGAGLVFASLFVVVRIYCWHGCVTPFDETWRRRIEAAAIVRDEAAGLAEGQRQIVTLSDEYSDLSQSGEAFVERVDGDLVIILMQAQAGYFYQSALVHAPGGVADRGLFLDVYCIVTVRSQGASWYEVFLNDYFSQIGPCP